MKKLPVHKKGGGVGTKIMATSVLHTSFGYCSSRLWDIFCCKLWSELYSATDFVVLYMKPEN